MKTVTTAKAYVVDEISKLRTAIDDNFHILDNKINDTKNGFNFKLQNIHTELKYKMEDIQGVFTQELEALRKRSRTVEIILAVGLLIEGLGLLSLALLLL